jgi:glycosyltransferase involved in cell wall biosynthesis
MRVLLVCDWFLKYAADLARGLRDVGADVALLCRDHAHEFGDLTDEREQLLEGLSARGVDVLVLAGRTSSRRSLVALPALRRQIVAWSPDVVHAQSNYEPRLLAISRGRPTVVTVHDPVPHPGQPRPPVILRSVAAAWLRRADRVVVHGEPLRAALPPRLRARAVVIPHGLSPASSPLPPPASPAVLLFGRLEPYKGITTLVEAMSTVWSQRPEVRLIVAGTGPAGNQVPSDLRIERRDGYIPEEEIPNLFASASLVVLPYTQASHTGVGALAVAAGVPVVVSEAGSLPDLAIDPSFVVRTGDPAALAAAILRHIDDDYATRSLVLDTARRTRSWRVVAARHRELYEAVICS